MVTCHQGLPAHDIFGIDALALESGELETFRQFRGKATTSVVADQFNFLVDAEQDIATDMPILTRLFPETRIFSTDGTEQDPGVVQPELKATVDGVLALSDMDPDEIRAAFILVSEKIDLDTLVADQAVDVFGFEGGDGCFGAETILADGGG